MAKQFLTFSEAQNQHRWLLQVSLPEHPEAVMHDPGDDPVIHRGSKTHHGADDDLVIDDNRLLIDPSQGDDSHLAVYEDRHAGDPAYRAQVANRVSPPGYIIDG